jgi:hypothetical protein
VISKLEDESSKPSPNRVPDKWDENRDSLLKSPSIRRPVAIFSSIAAMAVVSLILKQTGLLHWRGSTDETYSQIKLIEMTGPVIGQIQAVEGQVELRPPRGTQFFPARPQSLVAEALIQTKAASAAVIEFREGPTLRLLPNSRLVAELDPTLENTVHATLLAGDFIILNPGSSKTFTISQNGINLDNRTHGSDRRVPLVPMTDTALAPQPTEHQEPDKMGNQEFLAAEITEKLEAEKESELATMPTVDVATSGLQNRKLELGGNSASNAAIAAQNKSREKAKLDSSLLRSSLTNDDIRTQIKAQAGGVQKCYVSMVNRMSEASDRNSGELPRGEIIVAFKIFSSGKIDDGRVVNSPFQDQLFNRCVVEALHRVRLRPFEGAAIPVSEFPILLE